MENITNSELKKIEEKKSNIKIIIKINNLIEDIFEYSNNLNQHIPKFKENSNINI